MPLAARAFDAHVCQRADPVSHVGGPILDPACRTVFIGGRNAARVGDTAVCAGGAHDVIVEGEPTVLIGGRAAARIGDATDGGFIAGGCPTVIIGPHPRATALRMAAESGVPFCEKPARRSPEP